MAASDTFLRLQKDILLLQGFKAATPAAANTGGLSLIKEAFPGHIFPLGAVHEFVCDTIEEKSVSSGFVCGIASFIMKRGGVGAWIGASGTVFPHALKAFGIEPDRFFFVDPSNEKEKLWVIEEVVKCNGFSVVIADIRNLGFTESRRFQLAVEHSGVTGFLLRRNTTIKSCAVTRWHIKPAIGDVNSQLPGIGYPQWNVTLLKVRNGKPGSWMLEWKAGAFHHVQSVARTEELPLRKVG